MIPPSLASGHCTWYKNNPELFSEKSSGLFLAQRPPADRWSADTPPSAEAPQEVGG